MNVEQIRKRRKERGWSQVELAVAAGVSQRTVQNAEAGKPIHASSHRALVSALTSPDVAEGDPVAEQWPEDVRTYLDILGAALTALEPPAREQVMRDVIQLFVARRFGGVKE